MNTFKLMMAIAVGYVLGQLMWTVLSFTLMLLLSR